MTDRQRLEGRVAVTRTDTIRTWPARAYRDTFAPTAPDPVEGAELPPGRPLLPARPADGRAAPRRHPGPRRRRPGHRPAAPPVRGEEMTFHHPIRPAAYTMRAPA
ncbi:hypothetical protein [Nonomuraea salmonea]|uniref:hypothetical protein n=1 Tax=Nonomuraea salmonea TaxID=46181 RepID=UPI002FEB2B22